jgi:hypothetical protein
MIQDVQHLQYPSATAIRAALIRICASRPFKAAPRLASFLRFVVEAVLDGRGRSIKAYTVAVEALGRPATFDPATDAYVRVEAGRLRLALSRYYDDIGAEDPVIIDVGRGSYVPLFRLRAVADPNTDLLWLAGPVAAARDQTLPRPCLAPAAVVADLSSALSALRECHFLFAECHHAMTLVCSNAAKLSAELAISRSVVERSHRLIARAQSLRHGQSTPSSNDREIKVRLPVEA